MSATIERRGGLRLPPAPERLLASLVRDGNCTVRLTNQNQKGYSRITVNGRQVLAHRLAYEIAYGPIPAGLFVCHRCDNPPCCNPDHLFLGTVVDNNRDMWAKGRGKLTSPPWRRIPTATHPDIKARFKSGESKASIAASYGVTRQAIHYLLRKWGMA